MNAQKTIQRKDMTNMSFVGLHHAKDGIVGFADSKATLLIDNVCIEDVDRGEIKKIFKNKNFIFVTYGNNLLFSNRTQLEDYIHKSLDEDINYQDFFQKLFDKLTSDKPNYNDGFYYFVVGSKDAKGFYILNVTIDLNKNNLVFSEKSYDRNSFGGEQRYIDIYLHYPMYNHLSSEIYASQIKQCIENLIQSIDVVSILEYNSVGLPINVEIFQ